MGCKLYFPKTLCRKRWLRLYKPAASVFILLVFPKIRIVCHFSLIVFIPPLNHTQWNKALWRIWRHLCLCYGKGWCIIKEILQHFLRVFHKRVQAWWCWVTRWCLLGQLVQGLNWDTNLCTSCSSTHCKWVLHPFLWLGLKKIELLVWKLW